MMLQTAIGRRDATAEDVVSDWPCITIVADDLTGACDAGVAFLVSGRRVRVVLDATVESEAGEVRSMTTESRNFSAVDAARCVAESMTSLRAEDGLLFKKVDSAARGHFAAEILAAMQASGAQLALIAPAFPDAGRVVENGVLRVRDVSGQECEVVLRDLFAEESSVVDVLYEGSLDHLKSGVEDAIARGTRILLCDARVQRHLEELVTSALMVEASILWVGSAGLAHALAKQLPKTVHHETPFTRREGEVVLFAGTPHPVTRLQVSQLDEQHVRITVDCGKASEQEICEAFESRSVAALILTGGDTAALVLRSLKTQSLVLHGEIACGIPWGVVVGGMADGCLVITKSGGFGDLNALRDAFAFCERRQHEAT